MWIGYWLFRIGAFGGKIINLLGLSMIPKKLILILIAMGIFTLSIYGNYYMFTRLQKKDIQIHDLNTTIESQVNTIEQYRQQIIDKEQAMFLLKKNNEQREQELEKVNTKLKSIIRQARQHNISEKKAKQLQKEIATIIANSYNCIMQASGNKQVSCEH